MDKAALLTFATAIFTILNPIGNVAIFADLYGNLWDFIEPTAQNQSNQT